MGHDGKRDEETKSDSRRYSPDGGLIASCSDDKTIRVFDERSGKTIHVFHDSKGFANHLVWRAGRL